MKKTKGLIVLLLFFCKCYTFGQPRQGQARIDSLRYELIRYHSNCLKPCIKDTVKVKLLYSLAWEFCSRKTDTAEVLIQDAIRLSTDINWKDGLASAHNTYGWLYYNKSQYHSALNEYQKAVLIWEGLAENESVNSKYIIRKGMAFGNIGLVYSDLRQLDSALLYHNKSLSIKEQFNDIRGSAKDLSNIGIVYKNKSDFDKALDYYGRALEINRKFMNRESEAKNLGNIANVYTNTGAYSRALDFLLQSLKLNESLSNKKGVATQLSNISRIYHTLNKEEKAIEYAIKSSKVYEEIGNLRGLADNLHMLGEIYYKKKDYIMTSEYYYKALSNYESLNFEFGKSKIYGDLGNLYADLGDLSDTDSVKNKNYIEAFNYYNKSLEIGRRLNDLHSIAVDLGNIGSLCATMKNYSEAESFLLEAEKVCLEAKDFYTLIDQYRNLSKLYKLTDKSALSLQYFEKYIGLKDSIFSESKAEEITKLELNYNFEKKEAKAQAEYERQLAVKEARKQAEITILEEKKNIAEAEKKLKVQQAENSLLLAETKAERMKGDLIKNKLQSDFEKKQLIQETEAKLNEEKLIRNAIAGGAGLLAISAFFSFFFYKRKKDAEHKQKETSLNLQVSETEMKALRSQMNPHFIFNALQSIQSFLLSHRSDEANTYLLKFSKLMRSVLENSQHSEVPLKEDMQALEWYMQLESLRLKYPFTYTFHIDESVDIESTGIPPLILQPFVENAIWHGLQYKEEPGHINIYISRREGALIATVEDNGVGREASTRVKHPMLVKKESLGMKLTEERLKILNELKNFKSKLQVTDLFNNNHQPIGTKVEVSLPLGA